MRLVIGIVIGALAGRAAGQDLVLQNATVIDGTGSPPREGVQHDMQQLVEVGLTPLEALSAATTNGARVLGIEGRTGTIAVDREADLIIVDRNPLEDLRVLFEPLLVVTDGKVVLDRLYPNPYAER